LTLKTYFVVGPTAIGKSAFAINLAKQVCGNVINADSMQVYRDLEVLTARPSTKELAMIDHHLYGYVSANERYSVEKWCNDASKKIDECHKKELNSIVVGGTGMYIDKLINGIVDIPLIPEYLKLESERIIDTKGLKYLSDLIRGFDSESLKKINVNDTVRLRRIWEVYTHTGKPLSKWKKNNSKYFIDKINYKLILFLPDRLKNYEKVNSRFVSMFSQGAVEEVRNLLKLEINNSFPIMRAHGVPEIRDYLENKIGKEDCINRVQQVTRNYVKRQHTWWNSSKLDIFKKFNQFPDEIEINSMNFN